MEEEPSLDVLKVRLLVVAVCSGPSHGLSWIRTRQRLAIGSFV
jgi:hypothetical protein